MHYSHHFNRGFLAAVFNAVSFVKVTTGDMDFSPLADTTTTFDPLLATVTPPFLPRITTVSSSSSSNSSLPFKELKTAIFRDYY